MENASGLQTCEGMAGGWDDSAQAWIEAQGEAGDFGRKFVLDPPMIERVKHGSFRTALDVGCGEGRFCRIMRTLGIATVGIDPTETLIARARSLDPRGDYRVGVAEGLHDHVRSESFDLVVSYLTLIDIPDIATAISEMARALQPGGTLLVANLTSFSTAGAPRGWARSPLGKRQFCIDNYLEEREVWVEWSGIRIANWHRPLATYMSLLLQAGLQLTHFTEPAPIGGDAETVKRYSRVPWFYLMEWRKP